jgi:hypothetical protein
MSGGEDVGGWTGAGGRTGPSGGTSIGGETRGEMADSPLHGILAEFASPEALTAAARNARAEGYAALDAFTPFPVSALKEVLGHHDRRVQGTMLIGAIAGAMLGLGLQTYATVLHYPLNIGGRPDFSWPAYVIIIFELAVLCSGLSGLAAILAFNGLPKPHHPVFAVPGFERATRDRFFLLIEARDARFVPQSARAFLCRQGALEVIDVPV